MDSPSQPVNNHHVHSHTTTESKYAVGQAPERRRFDPLSCSGAASDG